MTDACTYDAAISARTALRSAVGDAPPGKPLACHHCDNPRCRNTQHLYWGDNYDNSRDMMIRGRGPWTQTLAQTAHAARCAEEDEQRRRLVLACLRSCEYCAGDDDGCCPVFMLRLESATGAIRYLTAGARWALVVQFAALFVSAGRPIRAPRSLTTWTGAKLRWIWVDP